MSDASVERGRRLRARQRTVSPRSVELVMRLGSWSVFLRLAPRGPRELGLTIDHNADASILQSRLRATELRKELSHAQMVKHKKRDIIPQLGIWENCRARIIKDKPL